jgi:hypothetical protein
MSDCNLLKPSVSDNKNVGTLSGLELTFARTELESYTTARTQNIDEKIRALDRKGVCYPLGEYMRGHQSNHHEKVAQLHS